ncbi:MAG: hypothetical protein Q9178_004753 [Gyalolechia marmorata]
MEISRIYATIDDLSNELLQLIINHLARPGWPIESLLNATLVRRLTVPIGTRIPKFTKALLQYLQRPEGERLVIQENTFGGLFADDLYSELVAILPRFSKLKTIKIVPDASAPPGYDQTVRVVPQALFVAMESLYPRVCVDIRLCGSRSDCQKILTDYSGFHAVNLAYLREEGQLELNDRVNVDITCLLRQSSLTKLRVVFNYGWQFRSPQVEADYKRLGLRELDFESDEVPEQQFPA